MKYIASLTLAAVCLAAPAFAQQTTEQRAVSAFNEASLEPAPTLCDKVKVMASIAKDLHDAEEHYLIRGALIYAVDYAFSNYPMEENRDWYVAAIDGVSMSYGLNTPSC